MQWYYAEDGKQLGPATEAEFQSLVNAGKITPQTLVWHAGMASWAAYESLSPAGPQPAPAAPAPAKAAALAAAAAAGGGTGICRECHKIFPLADMITYEGATICASCKPAFFQRLQEGAPPSRDAGGEGNTPNRELMAQARAALQGNWGGAIGICVVFVAIVVAASMAGVFIPFLGQLVQIFLAPPLLVGVLWFFLALCRGENAAVGMIGHGFGRYWLSVGASFMQQLIVNLWTLLAALPGIIVIIVFAIKNFSQVTPEISGALVLGILLLIPAVFVSIYVSYMYGMVMFIVSDDSEVGVMDSLRRSQTMMRGMKWKFFCLNLRFIGWALLAVLTCGIGFLWLGPYLSASCARFYDDVRGRAA